MADFSVVTQSTGSGSTVLRVAGDLDLASAATMRAAGLDALAEPDCSTLVLDLTAQTLIDSTGIGTLVDLHTHAHQHEQHLVLRGVSDILTRVLTIAGVTTMFTIEPAGGNLE